MITPQSTELHLPIASYSHACKTTLHKSKSKKLRVVSGHTFPLYIVLLVCLAAPSVPADPTTSPTYKKRTRQTDMNNNKRNI